MKIAILGATSQIAKDLILSFSTRKDCILLLFSRDVILLEKWISNLNLGDKCNALDYLEFSVERKYDVIINFVGAGNPLKIQKMGMDIFNITSQYDNMAIEYIKNHKETKYIFLSSGAVYGGNYQEPINCDSVAVSNINNIKPTDYYALAKLSAEIKHRSLAEFFIVDVRVFNYFSHRQNMEAKFLITDITRSIRNRKLFKTSALNILRDFITPIDFYNVIRSIIGCSSLNKALDCYTKSPISKFDLLTGLANEFELKYEFDKTVSFIDATSFKMNYYSTCKSLENIGYSPKYSSMEGVSSEIRKYLDLI